MILSIPGSFTDPQNWIIQSCMRAWEFVENKKHLPRTKTSGATDANILRRRGNPHRTSRHAASQPARNENQRSRFSMETSNVAGHETTDKVFGVCSHRHLYARARRSYQYSMQRSGQKPVRMIDTANVAWNLTSSTQSIRTASGGRERSPWPRYDEAALGFRNYWYPAMLSHKLGAPTGGATDPRREFAVRPVSGKMFCGGGPLRPSRHPTFRGPMRIPRHQYHHLPLSWLDFRCRQRHLRRSTDRRTRFADRRQSKSKNLSGRMSAKD